MNLEPYYTKRWHKKKSYKIYSLIVITVSILLTAIVVKCEPKHLPNPAMLKSHDKAVSLEQLKYQYYFEKAGAGIHAAEVASAVRQSKRKKLTAAICKVESDGKKTALNKQTKAKGLFQVKEGHWGKVNTKSALAMTAQHDRIMDELLEASGGNLSKALNAYGGSTDGEYAKTVLAELNSQFLK